MFSYECLLEHVTQSLSPNHGILDFPYSLYPGINFSGFLHISQFMFRYLTPDHLFAMLRVGFIFFFEFSEWMVWLGMAVLVFVFYLRRKVQRSTCECRKNRPGSVRCRAQGRRRPRGSEIRRMHVKTSVRDGVADAALTMNDELLNDRSAPAAEDIAWVLEQYYGGMAEEEFQNLSNFSAA